MSLEEGSIFAIVKRLKRLGSSSAWAARGTEGRGRADVLGLGQSWRAPPGWQPVRACIHAVSSRRLRGEQPMRAENHGDRTTSGPTFPKLEWKHCGDRRGGGEHARSDMCYLQGAAFLALPAHLPSNGLEDDSASLCTHPRHPSTHTSSSRQSRWAGTAVGGGGGPRDM